MHRSKLWYLSNINLFDGLDMSELQEINRVAPMVSVRRGTVLLRPGEPPRVLYLLKRGRVRIYALKPSGRAVTLAILGDGNVFGAAGPLDLCGASTYAEVMDEALICAMRDADVEDLLRRRPQVALRLINLLSQRLRELEDTIQNLASEEVGRRLLFLLVGLARKFGVGSSGDFVRVDVPLTHEDIATMVGSTRETVTATLSSLAKENLVRTGRREIQVNIKSAESLLAAPRARDAT